MANGDVLKPEEITEKSKDEEVEKTEGTKSENGEALSKETQAQIVRQLEYYFGDINLPRDKFLKEQIQLDDGWVPLSVLITFKRLSALSSDCDVIVKIVLESDSTLLEVSDDRKKIRRNPELPIPEYNEDRRKELMTRTAYAKGFPKDEKLEQIMKFFEEHGPQENVHMRHYFDKANKKAMFKGSVFVIFKDIDTCKKFIEAEEIKYNDSPLIRKWQMEYIEEKKQEREERQTKRGKGKKDKDEPEAKKHKFPKGAILFMEGFTKEDTTREAIKEKIIEVGGTEPAYITFDKGNKEGYVRFSDENGAADFAKKLTDNKLEVDGNDLTIKVLEGDEEEKFLTDLSETLEKIRHQNKNKQGRGKKRKGFGDSGPRNKQKK